MKIKTLPPPKKKLPYYFIEHGIMALIINNMTSYVSVQDEPNLAL